MSQKLFGGVTFEAVNTDVANELVDAIGNLLSPFLTYSRPFSIQ